MLPINVILKGKKISIMKYFENLAISNSLLVFNFQIQFLKVLGKGILKIFWLKIIRHWSKFYFRNLFTLFLYLALTYLYELIHELTLWFFVIYHFVMFRFHIRKIICLVNWRMNRVIFHFEYFPLKES